MTSTNYSTGVSNVTNLCPPKRMERPHAAQRLLAGYGLDCRRLRGKQTCVDIADSLTIAYNLNGCGTTEQWLIEFGSSTKGDNGENMTDYQKDCLFCKMVRGEEKCLKLYEDDSTLVIVDIGQVIKKDGAIIPGRSLVIPKRHVVRYYELEDEEAGHLFIAATKIARKIKRAFDPQFVTVFIRGQQVAHCHIILQPSTGEGDPIDAMFMGVREFFKLVPEATLIEMAQKINEA